MKPSQTRWMGGAGLVVVATALVAVLAAPETRAQNALGGGRALDANLQVGSGGYNGPARDFSGEIALRNAIVTGNVGGGKAFRGNVGYSAVEDFRGALGSNDLFRFNRDAAYSSVAAQNLRGLGALQFQLGQTTGGLSRGVAGDLIIRRSGAGTNTGELVGMTAPQGTATIDQFGRLRSSLRSTSDFIVRSASLPTVLMSAEGNFAEPSYVTATPLQGIKTIGMTNSALGMRLPDVFSGRAQQGDRGIVQPDVELGEADAEVDGVAPLSNPIAKPLNSQTAHQRLLEDMRDRMQQFQPQSTARRLGDVSTPSEPTEPTEPREAGGLGEEGDGLDDRRSRPAPAPDSLEARLEELRREFSEARELPWQRDERLRRERREEYYEEREADRLRENLAEDDPLSAANDVRRAEADDRTDTERLIRRARETLGPAPSALTTLIEQEGTDDLYTIHMRRGQDLLEEDKWFAAEERFSAALRARPGDAMAAAGRVSAEIGAGMYRSAAMNLRTLLAAYPEMLQTRLSDSLFPTGERLMRVRAQLRMRSERDTPLARDVGFLLAYVGAQTGNQRDVQDGFAVVDRVDAATGSGSDKLEQVARALWLGAPTK